MPLPRKFWGYAAVALLALAAYHNAVGCGFVLDDYHYILENRQITSWSALPSLLTAPYVSAGQEFFRPLATADLLLDKLIFGLRPWGFHLHNVLWHVAACVALLALLQKVVERPAALVAALLYAVHPVHTEAVTGIVGRTELMAAFFVFAGAALYLRGHRWSASACALAAALAKETGITLPLVALSLALWAQREPFLPSLRRAAAFVLPLAIYAGLRAHALSHVLVEPAFYFRVATPAQSFFTAVDTLGRYLSLSIWPHPLSADYSFAALPISPGLTSLRTLITVAALGGLAWSGYLLRRQFPILGWGAALFLVTIFPVSNLVVHIGILMAERVLYLPSFAVCLVGGALLAALRRRARLADGLIVALLLGLTGLTLARNTDWQTPLSLWRDTVAKEPRSGLAHANLALSCLVISDRACAISELQTAVALDPSRPDFAAALAELTR